jgi:hypothetical protein
MLHKYFSRYYKAALPLFLLILFFAIYLHPTKELFVDLGGHLLKGKLVIQTHSIPTTNTVSYTYPAFHFVNLQWLSEVVFYLVFLFSGINGLILFTTAVAFIAATIIYTFAAKRLNIILVSFLAVCYLIITAQRADVLVEVFSYLFIAIFTVILYKFREKYTNLIWLLIPLQLLWVNMHIYFILGILLVGLFLFEGLIVFRQKYEGKYLKTLAILLVSTFIVSLLNPYGLSGLLFPFTFTQNYGYSVAENASIFHQSNYVNFVTGSQTLTVQMFEIVSVLFILALILQYRKIRLIDALISIITIVGAIVAIRDLGIFVFMTFIPVAFIFNSLFEKYQWMHHRKFRNALLFCFPLLIIAFFFWTSSQLGGLGLGITHGNENGVDFFINNKISGPIFNNYNIGSYLAYRLYPQEHVFVDTWPEAYPASFFKNVYTPMFQKLYTFQTEVNQYHFNSILYGYDNGVPNDVGFLKYLMNNNKQWKVVYLDDSTIIFVKNISQNKAIIQQYAMTDNTFRLPSYQTFSSLYNLAHFLDLTGWRKSELMVFQRMHELNPKDCPTMRNVLGLANYLHTPNNPVLTSDLMEYNIYCH